MEMPAVIKSFTAESGEAHTLCDNGIETVCLPPIDLLTIICRGNPALLSRLHQVVLDEYGDTVEVKISANIFGDDLVRFLPK